LNKIYSIRISSEYLEPSRMKDLVRVHAIVTGKVQGVGFRAFTQNQATQKGIAGCVRNREDGSVEVEAEGPRVILDDFLKVLKEGPGLSNQGNAPYSPYFS
jgi:acylphosphatase